MSATAEVSRNVNVLLFPSLLYFLLLILLQRGSKMKDYMISFPLVERKSAKKQKVLNRNENNREKTEQEFGKRQEEN